MYVRLLLICLISFSFLSWQKKERIPYERFREACIHYDANSFDLHSYDHIFIMHIGFCASTEYCNERMVEYIQNRKDEKSLVIYDMKDNYYTGLLSNISNIDLKFMDREYLQRHNVFSVYNIHIKKKRVIYLY